MARELEAQAVVWFQRLHEVVRLLKKPRQAVTRPSADAITANNKRSDSIASFIVNQVNVLGGMTCHRKFIHAA